MEEKKCFLIIRDKSFYFMTNEDSSIYQCEFETIESIPGIYCFLNLFEKLDVNTKFLKKFMINNNLLIKSSVFKKSHFNKIFLAVPDDLLSTEKRCLEEFLFLSIKLGIKVNFISENMLVTTEEKEYICVYRTVRMVVVSYISNNEVKAKLLLERKDYTEVELEYIINNIHYDVKVKRLKVYLIGDGMEKYSSIGQIVNYDKILKNFVQIT